MIWNNYINKIIRNIKNDRSKRLLKSEVRTAPEQDAMACCHGDMSITIAFIQIRNPKEHSAIDKSWNSMPHYGIYMYSMSNDRNPIWSSTWRPRANEATSYPGSYLRSPPRPHARCEKTSGKDPVNSMGVAGSGDKALGTRLNSMWITGTITAKQ